MKTKKKILVVEDDICTSKLLDICLSDEGFDVICVFTGKDAIVACTEHPDIDLVLEDGTLVESNDGLETAKTINGIRKDIPIICISKDDIPDEYKGYKQYFVAHCKKPFPSMEILIDLIKETLVNHKKNT